VSYFIIIAPKTCHSYQLKGANKSGFYDIDPDSSGEPFTVECNFETGNTFAIVV
jgi:hypothetical protein